MIIFVQKFILQPIYYYFCYFLILLHNNLRDGENTKKNKSESYDARRKAAPIYCQYVGDYYLYIQIEKLIIFREFDEKPVERFGKADFQALVSSAIGRGEWIFTDFKIEYVAGSRPRIEPIRLSD